MNRYLVDVNTLIALADEDHIHNDKANRWLQSIGDCSWGPCAFSQAGFLRVTANPKRSRYSITEATEVLFSVSGHPGYRLWPIVDEWATLAAPFMERIFGHQQITDAWLLGLAIQNRGILVTFDKGIRHLAGADFADHVLVLE